MADPQIPTADSILAAATSWLAANRTSALPHIGDGNYANVLQGWRSQVSACISRIAAEVKASRLPFSQGQDLLDLAASEFDTFVSPDPLFSQGQLTLFRANGPAGIIRKGFRVHRLATTQSIPQLKDAVYETTRDVPVAKNQEFLVLPLQATSTGDYANHPNGSTGSDIVLSDIIFDPNFTFSPDTNFTSAGGANGISDPALRAACKAYFVGRYGPTISAIRAGTLRSTGVAKYLTFEDTTFANTYVVPVDGTWSASPALDQAVYQLLVDSPTVPGFGGFGCRFYVGQAAPLDPHVLFSNVFISLNLAVVLRDQTLLANTGPIEVNIQNAALSYFNDRPDWNVFRLNQLMGRIASCDRRIQACTSATVLKLSDGSTISEPTGVFGTPMLDIPVHVNHYYLDSANCVITYNTPI